MRLKIELRIAPGNHFVLPINYQYPVSSWIYKTIYEANPEFATWLHDNGYSFEKKGFKLFCFSNINFKEAKIYGDRITALSSVCNITLSFLVPEAIQHFVKGCFINQKFSLGDNISHVNFYVKSLEILKKPNFTEKMIFETSSPICMSQKRLLNGKLHTAYLSPIDSEYAGLLLSNLKKKFISFTGRDIDVAEFHFKLLSEPKSKLISVVKQGIDTIKFRAFHYHFEIQAPPELIEIGYFAGFGEKNSLGCGFVNLLQ